MALATLACLALLGGSLPAPATVPADSRGGLHQTSCTGGPVPCQAQRKTGDAGDPGVWDCFPASVYMALYGMQAESILPSPLNLSWDRVRSEMRKEQPDPGLPVGQYVALSLVQSLTSNNAAADLVQTTDANWKSFLADQLAAGYPVATQMLSWVLPGSTYGTNHSIVVTGIDDANVYYIDPWDGAAHTMTVGDFATAWSSGWYAVTFSTQSLGAGAPAAPTPQALLPGQTVSVAWQGDGAQYETEIWNETQTKWNASDWISQTSWDSGLQPDSTLLWRVRARSGAEVVGPWSLPGPVTAGTVSPAPANSGSGLGSAPASLPPAPVQSPSKALTVPGAPTRLTAQETNPGPCPSDDPYATECMHFQLNWSPATGQVSGYHIYSGRTGGAVLDPSSPLPDWCRDGNRSGETPVASAPAGATSFDLPIDGEYAPVCIGLAAYNSAGESVWTVATVTEPAALALPESAIARHIAAMKRCVDRQVSEREQ